MILIVSIDEDLHARVIQRRLVDRGYRDAHIIPSDLIAKELNLSLRLGAATYKAKIERTSHSSLDIGAAKVLWWRRPRADQRLDNANYTETETELINNDC